jgi:hypothetical protein
VENRDQIASIVNKYHQLKQQRHDNMVKRGNFISKNMENMRQNVRDDDWIGSMLHKYDQRQVQHDLVVGRKEAVLRQNRD